MGIPENEHRVLVEFVGTPAGHRRRVGRERRDRGSPRVEESRRDQVFVCKGLVEVCGVLVFPISRREWKMCSLRSGVWPGVTGSSICGEGTANCPFGNLKLSSCSATGLMFEPSHASCVPPAFVGPEPQNCAPTVCSGSICRQLRQKDGTRVAQAIAGAKPLICPEEESPVLEDRAAQGSAKLVLLEHRARLVRCVQEKRFALKMSFRTNSHTVPWN